MKHLRSRILVLGLMFILLGGTGLYARYGRGLRKNAAVQYYDARTEKVISGKIVKIKTVDSFGYGNRNYKSVELEVKANTKTYVVHIGPEWYVNDKVNLKVGDKITVTGSYTKVNSKYMIIVREIKRNGKTYRFREKDGVPIWAGANRKYRRRK